MSVEDSPSGERAEVTAEVEATLADFVQNVFCHIPGKRIVGVGTFLGAAEAQGAIQACVDCVRPTRVDVRTESFANLSEHAEIPIAFTVQRVFEIEDGPAGVVLTERLLDAPYVEDYDAYETPMRWVKRFDLSTARRVRGRPTRRRCHRRIRYAGTSSARWPNGSRPPVRYPHPS
jgi:hypothetical protein